MTFDFRWMDQALDEARAGEALGEVPIGAVLVGPDGTLLSAAHNRVALDHDPTAHAEILAIRAASSRLGNERLDGCDLWVTLEPCAMCAQAIAFARIRRLYFGADDPKGGGVLYGARIFDQKTVNHRPEIYPGIREQDCAALLRAFFQRRRG